MIRCLSTLYLLFLIVLCTYPQSGDYRYECLTQKDGLSHNHVTCLLQDSNGFLWIGTEQGLNRYDGYNIREFKHDPADTHSLSTNFITALYEDPADSGNVLWVGTRGGGLNRFDLETETFSRYTHHPDDTSSLSDNDIQCIYKDSRGVFWVGTAGGGLNRFDPEPGTFIHYRHDPDDAFSLLNNNIISIHEDHLGYVWAGTRGRGLNQICLYNDSSLVVPRTATANDHITYNPVPDVWEYDPQRDSARAWERKTDIPTARWAASSCVYDNMIYVLGGVGMPKPPDTPALSIMEVYDPQTDSWKNLIAMGFNRAGLRVNQINAKIYAIGGFQFHWSAGITAQVFEEYHIGSKKWIRKKDLSRQMGDFATVVLNDKIYMIGGSASDMFTTALKTCSVYDPNTDQWTSFTPMNSPRAAFDACALNGKIYAIGGMSAAADAGLKTVEVYDPLKDTWSYVKDLPEARSLHAAVVLNSKIIVLGGIENFRLKNSVFEYNPVTDAWSRLPDMPVKRASMAAEVWNGKVYVISGWGYGSDMYHSSPGKLNCIRYRRSQFDRRGLPSENIYALHEDKEGRLWIGTGSGLRVLDRSTYHFIRHRFRSGPADRVHTAGIQDIFEDDRGELWIASFNDGLFRISPDRKQLTHFTSQPGTAGGLSSSRFSSILKDRSGIVWAGSISDGLQKLIPARKSFVQIRHLEGWENSLAPGPVTALAEDEEGVIWIGTSTGLLDRFDPRLDTFKHYRFDTFGTIRAIVGSGRDALWLDRTNCLTKCLPESGDHVNYYGHWLTYFTHMPDFAISWIRDLFKQNLLIASINNAGNNQQKEAAFEIRHKREVLIVAQGEASLNKLVDKAWLTREPDHATVWEMEAVRTRISGANPRNRIHLSTLILSPGTYRLHYQTDAQHAYGAWFGEAPLLPELWGISVYRMPAGISKEIIPFLLKNNRTTNFKTLYGFSSFLQDRSGRLWCVKDGLLYQFSEDTREFAHCGVSINGKPYRDMDALFEDRSGRLWIGSAADGLFERITPADDPFSGEDNLFRIFAFTESNRPEVQRNRIFSIAEGFDGHLWLATDAGLTGFDPEKKVFCHYDENDGLGSNLVLCIMEDNRNSLWLSTNRGLTRFDPRAGHFKVYTESHGLEGIEFTNACLKSRCGKLYFGNRDGLTVFHPDSLSLNLSIPPVRITDFRIFNKPVRPGAESPLKKSVSQVSEITLPHDQSVFTFEFAALDYTHPSCNKYAHKMEGVDPEWMYSDAGRRFATYTNLDPGSYVFRVKASNNDGIWNEEGTSVRIIVTPPWWKTNLAYIMYFVFCILLLITLRHYDLKRQRLKHELALEHEHAEKLLEIDHMKSRFFANISHEFRTPLTLILGPLQKMLDALPARAGAAGIRMKQELTLMQRNAQRLYRLINQLLDLSSLEAGGMTLQPRQENMVDLVRHYSQAFESLASQRHIAYRFTSEADEIIALVDRDKIEKILNNLLSNAFKFTAAGGRIDVALSVCGSADDGEDGRKVTITVSDTGIGIPEDRLDKIFDRFYQVDASQKREYEGTGIGLALTKELVELHHGTIDVRSEPGKGTVFTVRLPLHPGQYGMPAADTIPGEMKREPVPDVEPTSGGDMDTRDTPAEADRSKPLILVIEDNPDMRYYIQGHLLSEYKIMGAKNGTEGLRKAKETIPDLIISDVMMPGMDGMELCARIKTDENTSHIPVILLTARAAKEDRLQGLETGADDYIVKPFEADELKARVNNLIRQRRSLRKRFSAAAGLRPEDIAVTSADVVFLKKALTIIEKHIHDPQFSVEEFHKELALSRVQLHRKIHALTDQSTSAFIRSIRLNRAAQLLKKKSESVTQVAYDVGFRNPSHFSASFQKQFGMTPKEYLHRN